MTGSENPRPVPTTTVAWDGSAASRTALLWGIERERAGRASGLGGLLLVAVVDEGHRSRGAAALDQLAQAARTALDAEIAWVSGTTPEIDVDGRVVLGDPMIRLPEQCPPDALLVVGRRFHPTGAGRALAARLAATAAQPVVVVSGATAAENAQVVVGVDGTPAATRASVAAAAEADRLGVPLHVVHAWPGGSSALLEDVTNADDPQRARHERILTASVDAIRSDHPALVVRGHLDIGSPGRVLRRWASDAALLVVGSRGRGPVRRLLLGSVSSGLLDAAACPIMIVTAPSAPAPKPVSR